MKANYQKALKKVTSFFLLNSVPFSRQNYQKQKGPGTSDQLLFSFWNKFRKNSLLVMYYLTKFDDIKRFLNYSKNYICKFMQANLWHKLFHFHLPLWIWTVWKGREKSTKIWISWERKELSRWNKKTFFIAFEGLSLDGKI